MANKWRLNSLSGREILDKLAELFILSAVFFVPLWFAYFFQTYNVFELNKAVLFRSLTYLLLGVSVVRQIFYPSLTGQGLKQLFIKYWRWPALFIASLGLASYLSADSALSFYGTLERQQGLISYLAYFLWFVLVGLNLLGDQDGRKLRRIVVAAAGSATLVAVYGILQVLNIDFLTWPYAPHLTLRTFSTLGQPNFLASYLLLVAPLSYYLYWQAVAPLHRFVWLLALVLQVVCFFLTGSRGGFLGLFLAGSLLIAFWLAELKLARSKKILISSAFVLVAAASLLFLDVVSAGRVRELKNLSYGSFGARVLIYRAAFDAWPDKPFFGYGPENQADVFIKYYSPDWGVYGQVAQTADRAHNIVLDSLLSGGLIALVFQGLSVGLFFRLFYVNWWKNRQRQLSLALALGAAAYLLSLLVSFTVVTGELYFWLFFAVMIAINRNQEEDLPDNFSAKQHRPMIRVVKAVLTLLLLVFVWLGVNREIRVLIGNYYFQEIYKTLATEDYFAALVLDDYIAKEKVDPVSRAEYDVFWAGALNEMHEKISEPVSRQAVREKLVDLSGGLPFQGYNNILARAQVSRLLGDFEAADRYLQQLVEISIFWPTSYFELGRLSQDQGNYFLAVNNYVKALASLPDLSDWRLNDEHRRNVASYRYLAFSRLGDIHFQERNFPAAAVDFKEAFRSKPEDYSLLKKIGDAYYLQGDIERAIFYNQWGLARNPGDYAWHLALAALYLETGDFLRAGDYLRSAKDLKPDNQLILDLEKEYQGQ